MTIKKKWFVGGTILILLVVAILGTSSNFLGAMTWKGINVEVSSSSNSQSIVAGESNVEIIAFDLENTTPGNAEVSEITLSAYIDDDYDNVYSKSIDTRSFFASDILPEVWLEDDSGTFLGTTETFSISGEATFDSLSLNITTGDTETVHVYANTSSHPDLYDNAKVLIDIDDVITDIIATNPMGNTVKVKGSQPNWIENIHVDIHASGDLTIEESASSPTDDQIVAAGTDDVLVATLEATATSEDFEIDTLTISVTDSAGNPDATISNNVDSIKLDYPSGERTESIPITETDAIFTGLGIELSAGDTIEIDVYANFDEHTEEGGYANSDDAVYFSLNASSGDINAVGATSGEALTEDDFSDITTSGATYVYRTIPTIDNDTSIGSSLVPSADQEIYRFTVSASNTEALLVQYITLEISPTGLVEDGEALSLSNDISCGSSVVPGSLKPVTTTPATIKDPSTILDGISSISSSSTSAAIYVETNGTKVGEGCYDPDSGVAKIDMNISSSDGIVVAAGSSKIFRVYADIYEDTDASTTASISVRIHNDTSYVGAGTVDDIKGSDSNEEVGIIWSDYGSTGSHGEDVEEWMNGYKVPGMPVSYMTLSA